MCGSLVVAHLCVPLVGKTSSNEANFRTSKTYKCFWCRPASGNFLSRFNVFDGFLARFVKHGETVKATSRLGKRRDDSFFFWVPTPRATSLGGAVVFDIFVVCLRGTPSQASGPRGTPSRARGATSWDTSSEVNWPEGYFLTCQRWVVRGGLPHGRLARGRLPHALAGLMISWDTSSGIIVGTSFEQLLYGRLGSQNGSLVKPVKPFTPLHNARLTQNQTFRLIRCRPIQYVHYTGD